MTDLMHVTSAAFSVGAKGRVVLPAEVRRAAHVEPGTTLIARTDGVGRIVLESPDSIRERVWAAAPSPVEVDAAADVRSMRDEDARETDRAFERRAASVTSNDAGDALLRYLGL